MEKFYITTPIFYPTSEPHIGTSYTVFVADTLARYFRQKLGDKNVFFLTGTDEHGTKLAKAAEAAGKEPQAFVDELSTIYDNTWKELNATHDFFIRTTDKVHEKFAQELLQKSYDNGDIYEKSYEGLYCEGCESFKTESEIVDGKCPDHPTKTLVQLSEKNYFFRLSKYQDWLLQYLEEHKDFVFPVKWYDYIVGLVKEGLNDISISRESVKWGIPVPFDSSQTIYVWYDALPNYMSVFEFPEIKEKGITDEFWPEARHLVGKDIIKFHAILWPAMLKSAGLPLPAQVLVHGHFTVNGVKLGKSNGNAINPLELKKKYPTDAIRYALLTEFQFGNDGDFSIDRLEALYNGTLGNNYGNLLNRVIHLSNKKGVGINNLEKVEASFKTQVDEFRKRTEENLDNYEIKVAADVINELSTFGNKYIDDNKPWLETDISKVEVVLNNLSYLLSAVNDLYSPILPESTEKAKVALKNREVIILFPKLED
jgi:methionyl-tRNA synthetase